MQLRSLTYRRSWSNPLKLVGLWLALSLLPMQGWAAATCKSCQCWFISAWEDEDACVALCNDRGMVYSTFDGTNQCSCSSNGTTVMSCPSDSQTQGGCSDAPCGDTQVPEMSDYLTILFVIVAGGTLYYLRRRNAA